MSILSDIEIKALCENSSTAMIDPFTDSQVRQKRISFKRLSPVQTIKYRRVVTDWLSHLLNMDFSIFNRVDPKQRVGEALGLEYSRLITLQSISNQKVTVDGNSSWLFFEQGVLPGDVEERTVGSLITHVYKKLLPEDPEIDLKVISYGLSSYGYDFRLSNKFKIFTNVNTTMIDPKNFDEKSFVEFKGDTVIIPPNSFILGSSVERVRMPDDVTGVVLGKSTYARCGIDCLATPLEAGWEGYITLEFANTTPLPAIMYANEGCCQVLFLKGEVPCEVSYAKRRGKYMNQGDGPITPKV